VERRGGKMKKKVKILVAIFLAIFGLSGCVSKIMNPYSEEFTCPQVERGKCVPIQQAYLESLMQEKRDLLFTPTPPLGGQQRGNETITGLQNFFPQDSLVEAYSKYHEALMKKLQQMLESPKTPVLIPPQVVRVLILPYAVERDTFYGERYAYIIVEGPQWVFYNILNLQEENR
jgi:conjugal transfer pilus assembly protein TraV